METFRYVLGVMLVVGVPPAVVFWIIIHPLASFWRRIGSALSYVIVSTACLLLAGAVYHYRDVVMGPDLGTNYLLFFPGALLYGVSAWLSVITKRQLSMRIFAGVPELADDGSPGILLQEGVYGVIRHPRYLSVIVGTTGFALFVNYLGAYLTVLGTVPALYLVAFMEERELSQRFGEEYDRYRSRVPAIFPRIGRKAPPPLLLIALCFSSAFGGPHLLSGAQVEGTLREGETLQLRYERPGEIFEETLLLGNGRVGAALFGGIGEERIFLNDATLWAGGPVDPDINAAASRHLPAVREALARGDWAQADQLVRELQGKFSESYAPLGTLRMEMHHGSQAGDYARTLELAKATATVAYEMDGVRFRRDAFVSHPDGVMVMRLTASEEGALGFTLRFESLLRYGVHTQDGVLFGTGEAPVHAEPNYRGDIPNPIVYEDGKGTRFAALARIVDTDGVVEASGGTLSLRGASRATLLVSVATSFNGFDREPGTDGLDEVGMALERLEAASNRSYPNLHGRHTRDFEGFFHRVQLELGQDPVPGMSTDERLIRYAQGAPDPYLETLYFQFGRYLLISSSRTPGVPANLQGIWNPYMRPPWSSNYTTNINAEMNYWPAEVTGLPEMHEPFLSFIENLSVTGRITAETFWGTRGWSVSHNTDIWAMTNPVGDFGQGHPSWANWNMAGVWMATHLWDHFAFTQDAEFLDQRGYPLMKGAAEFALDWLVEGEDGFLITSPSTSPENMYRTPRGYEGATTYGTTADMAMIRELFTQVIRASEILGRDASFREELREAMGRLVPYRIGEDGSIQEWYHDWEDADPQHRHQTHLFGVYPGAQIDPEATPALAQAARRALEIKGDESTGWSKAWRINLWARLWDGDRAHKLYRELLRYVDPVAGLNSRRGGGTYPNLMDAHPPFQIDGNFGGTSGVAEMLLQSHGGTIRLLPALPSGWAEGRVSGLRARGGFEVDLEWRDGELQVVSLTSVGGTLARLAYGGVVRDVELRPGEKVRLNGTLR
jgi:alpha-L-fucosidase 2